jgi:hypothetical protein
MEYNHNGKLIHQIVKLEGELKWQQQDYL